MPPYHLNVERDQRTHARWAGYLSLALIAGVFMLPSPRGADAQKPAQGNDNQPGTTESYIPTVPETKPTSDITGVVKDEFGKPVANVSVVAVCDSEQGSKRRSAQTDPGGHFSFPALGPGYWGISVNDARYGWEWDHERGRTVPAKPEDLPVAITLCEARTLRGTVVDEGGKPVSGARVVLVNQTLPGSVEPISGHIDIDFLTATTDQAGRFTMERLRPGNAEFVMEHPDYANTIVDVDVTNKESALTIRKGLTLHGRVLHNGAAVPGVAVHVGMNEACRPMVSWTGKTDANGEFAAPRIRSWPADVRSKCESVSVLIQGPAWYSDVYGVYQTNEKELAAVTIEAEPLEKGKTPELGRVDVGKPVSPHFGAQLGGAVTVSVPGVPGSGADIFVESLASGEKPVEAFAELSNGKARLAALPPGKYMVSVFAGSDAIGPARPPKAFELTAGQALDVTLRPGAGRISGIVRSGGKAVGGGTISWFLTPGLPGAVFQGGAQAQSDGSYAIDGLIEGKYRLIYEGPNSMLYECMAELRRNATAFDISLPTGRIEGTLAASAPKPEPPDVESLGNIRVWPREHHLPPHGGCFVEADPNGKFRVEHLIPDRYTIEGYGYRTSVLIDRDGEVATASLGPPEQVGEIAGKITGNIPANLGNVRDGIQVTAFPKDEFGYDFDSGTYSTRFNPKTGEYRIRNVPVGTYGVYAAGLGFGTSRAPQVWTPDIEVRQGLCRQLPIEVPEGRTVSITIRGQAAAGHRAAQCQYWWLRVPSGDWLDEAVSSNMERGGRYVLPLGAYAIKADYGDGGLVTREFTVARGEGVQEITVQPPALPATGPTSQRAP